MAVDRGTNCRPLSGRGPGLRCGEGGGGGRSWRRRKEGGAGGSSQPRRQSQGSAPGLRDPAKSGKRLLPKRVFKNKTDATANVLQGFKTLGGKAGTPLLLKHLLRRGWVGG